MTRLKASSSSSTGRYARRYVQWKPERGQPAHRPLAAEHGAGEHLVLGLAQLVLGQPVARSPSVDLGDPAEVGLGLLGLAAQEGEERAGLVVVLVRELGAVGEARDRSGSSRAASRCGRRGWSPAGARRSGRRSRAEARRRRRRRSAAGRRRGGSPGMTPTRETAWRRGSRRRPASGRSGSGPARPARSKSALPAKASTMFAGLYRCAK